MPDAYNPIMAPSVALRSLNLDCTVPRVETHDEPTLLQKIKHEGSVLSLAVSDDYIFAGTQRNKILVLYVRKRADEKVWDIHTYEKRGALKGHQGSVLCLTLSDDKKLLFSSAGDAIVKVEFHMTFSNPRSGTRSP
jgi:di- and tripeptidase